MEYINENLLTILILFPAFGAVALIGHQLFWKEEAHLKWLTLAFAVVNFLISLALLGNAEISANGFYFEKSIPWIEAIGTNYHVGVDGFSLWLIILTTLIMPIAVLSTWHAVEKHRLCFA
jgi:NADH-quinone oxidoreductase subunit M